MRGIIITSQGICQVGTPGSASKPLSCLAPNSQGSIWAEFSPHFLNKGLGHFTPESPQTKNHIHMGHLRLKS